MATTLLVSETSAESVNKFLVYKNKLMHNTNSCKTHTFAIQTALNSLLKLAEKEENKKKFPKQVQNR